MDSTETEKILSLQLEWIKTADAKVPPLFSINVAMLGLLAVLMKGVTDWSFLIGFFAFLSIASLSISIIFLAQAMFPRLDGPEGSLIFFGGISKLSREEYISKVLSVSSGDHKNDILSQVHRNAEIATSKYKYVKKAFISTFISVPFWVNAVYFLYI